MKKVHLIIAAALAILACSCNKEQAIETVQDGEEVNVSSLSFRQEPLATEQRLTDSMSMCMTTMRALQTLTLLA